MQIQSIFTDVYGYRCNIEAIDQTVDENGSEIGSMTTVKTHFVDLEKNEPIEAREITRFDRTFSLSLLIIDIFIM